MYEDMHPRRESNSVLPPELKALLEKKIADINARIEAEKNKLDLVRDDQDKPLMESNSTIRKLEDEKNMLVSELSALAARQEELPEKEKRKAA